MIVILIDLSFNTAAGNAFNKETLTEDEYNQGWKDGYGRASQDEVGSI